MGLFFLFSIGNASVYGFERGPIIKVPLEPSAPNYYTSTAQNGCEHQVTLLRGTPFYPVPGPSTANILSMFTIPTDQNGHSITSGSASAYRCYAKVQQISPSQTYDVLAVWQYPVCNVGDPVSTITSETICTIPDTIPDKGINAGQPQSGSCIGNPVNTATGNKYAEEVDIVSSGGLSFSRYYNAKGLSGGSSAGSSWNHSFQRSLYVNPKIITATRPDGRTAYFRLTNSVWINQQAGGDVLAQIVGGSGW